MYAPEGAETPDADTERRPGGEIGAQTGAGGFRRFIPPAAEGLPPGVLDSATDGATMLDAWAESGRGRNFLAHALVQLARDGWLRQQPGAGFETVRDRDDAPEPQPAPEPEDQWDGLLVPTVLMDAIRRNEAEQEATTAALDAATSGERCCGCGGGPIVYRNFEDSPFCVHCANCSCGQVPCVRPDQPEQAATEATDLRQESEAWRRKAVRRAICISKLEGTIQAVTALASEEITARTEWGDGYRTALADLQDVLREFGHQPPAPAHDAGPTVAECAADDRRWPLEKHGE
jgi:hypothetical protein